MNKVKKLICACLILVMCFNTATVPVAGRIFTMVGETWGPLHIDILPALAATGYKDYINTIYLTISGDMVFKGKIIKLSEEELDKLCKEALDYIGETAETVRAGEKAYNELVEECKAMYERAVKDFGRANADKTVRDTVIANLPANLQIAGTGAQVIEDIVDGEVDLDTAATVAGTLFSLKTGTLFGLSAAATATLLTSVAFSLAKNMGFSRMVDRVIELEQQVYAYNDFIEILKRKLLKHKGTQTIIFTDAKATQKFTLFDAQFKEKWTLNMSLTAVCTDANVVTYQGYYTIDIEYEINEMGVAVYNSERKLWLATKGEPDGDAVLNSKGTAYGKRRLSGEAEARITVNDPLMRNLRGGRCSIEPNQMSDEKDVGAAGIQITFYGYVPIVENTTADQDNIYMVNPNAAITTTWDAEGDMYQRGNRAGSGWKMSLGVSMHSY